MRNKEWYNGGNESKDGSLDDKYSITPRKARASWDRRTYIKSLLCKELKYAPQELGNQAPKILGILCKIHRKPRQEKRHNRNINA